MINIHFKKVGIILSVCALSWAFSQKTDNAKADTTAALKKSRLHQKTSDSLQILSVILQSEFAAKNKVFICKNPTFADSLVRSLCAPSNFQNAIADSAVLKEIQSKEEFSRYWQKVELDNGITALKAQMDAEDIDKTLIPKAYAFDSSVVIYPGWIIIRGK